MGHIRRTLNTIFFKRTWAISTDIKGGVRVRQIATSTTQLDRQSKMLSSTTASDSIDETVTVNDSDSDFYFDFDDVLAVANDDAGLRF